MDVIDMSPVDWLQFQLEHGIQESYVNREEELHHREDHLIGTIPYSERLEYVAQRYYLVGTVFGI